MYTYMRELKAPTHHGAAQGSKVSGVPARFREANVAGAAHVGHQAVVEDVAELGDSRSLADRVLGLHPGLHHLQWRHWPG